MQAERNESLEFVRILASERFANGDKPYAICSVTEVGQNIRGEYFILLENSARLRLGSSESTICLNDDRPPPLMDRFAQSLSVFEQLKIAIVARLNSIRPASDESNIGLATILSSRVLLRTLSNAYLQLFELCSFANGRERLDFVWEITKSSQLKRLIECAIRELPAT